MADPLSIAASVAGLLGVAAKLSTVIGNFIANVSDAPESSRWALSVVTETRLTLQSIKDLMDRLPHLSRDRKDMIHIRHLVVVFREAVLSFSELEAMVCGNTQDNATPWQSLRVKWALEEDKIVKMIRRLQGHKTSLSTILNIIQCQSDIEARESLAKLQTTVDQLLQNQQQLLDRLERYETVLFETTSARFTGDGESESILIQRPPPARLPPATSAVSQGDPMLGLVLPADTSGSIAEKLFLREFELTLEQTRVYARVRSNKCDASVISSERGTATWSMLSGLSLNDISAISVLSLPISLEEMASIGPDLIFTHMLSNTQGSLHRVGGTPASAMKPGLIRFENPRASPRPPSSSVGTSVVELSKGLGNRGGNELFRIVVIGGEDNRENEMVNEFCRYELVPNRDPRGSAFHLGQLEVDGEFCMMEIVDLTGYEEYNRYLRDKWITDGDAFIIMYSVSSRFTFRRVAPFSRQIERVRAMARAKDEAKPPIILMPYAVNGTGSRTVISVQEEDTMAEQLGHRLFRTSGQAFHHLVRELRRQRKQEAEGPLKSKGKMKML